ncbi:leucine-rich repeat protein [Tractidigestivibacter scatoligenes]|nr:leucine-rich repeat protein [Tractidigestivibacter scatoligenes]
MAVLLAACLTAAPGLCPTPVLAEDANTASASQTQDISKGSAIDGTDYSVTSVKTYAIAPDITERTIVTNNAAGTSQTVANVMEINTANGNAKLAASYGNVDPAKDGWKMSTLTDQTHLYEKTYNENVVGGINASLFNITTGEPMGYLRMGGTTYKDDAKIPFVAVFSDGSVGIYPAGTTLDQAAAEQSKKVGSTVTVTDAAGGWCILVDGKTVATQGSNGGYYSRSAIGLKADGTVVMLQADGTMPPRSLGYTLEEMGRMMQSLGCTYALELDEGGSSEFVSQREGESDIAMRNTPAGGGERVISTSLLAVSTAAPSGEFDHAGITPNDNIFTPNTTVALTATGMDYSGAAAKSIPSGVSWSLTDDSKSLGELKAGDVSGDTASATFVSNGTCGTATVQLMYQGKVVGKTSIRIQNPDTLSFTSDEVNLNYEEKSDLGLTALYQQEPVILKDGDITWAIDDTKAGSFEGNTFVTTSDVTVSTSPKVTAKYGSLTATTTVNVGKQPTIVLDGGDDDGHDYSTIGTTVHSFDGMSASAVATYSYPSRGGIVTGSVVSDTDSDFADIIRFGHKAVKLDFDWTGITGTDGACLGLGSNIDVPGTPTALGAWVYIPEGAPVPWLRAQIATSKDGSTYTNAYINFTDQNSNGKDAKAGWNYFEADMTQYAGQKIRVNSGMLFRAMVTQSGIGWYTTDGTKLSKDQLKGYILVDNISFVYGANNQDVTAPTVKSLQIINDDGTKSDLADGAELKTNAPAFYATYDDNEDTDKFATGVESAYFYLDGTYYGAGDKDNLGSTLKGVQIPNGEHSLTFYLKDGFGNITRETRHFTVNGSNAVTIDGKETQLTGVSFATDGEPIVGKDWKLHLTTNNISDIVEMTATVQLSRGYKPTVQFSSGVTGTYEYADDTGKLTVSVTKVENASGSEIATITVPVSETSAEGSEISVQVVSGTYKVNSVTSDSNSYWMGFSTPSETHKITAAYTLSTEAMVVGLPTTITVKNSDGNAAADVDVYADDSTDLGKTDSDGRLTTSVLTKAEGTHTLYAKDSKGNRSYAYSCTAYKSTEDDTGKEGLPQYVHFNVSKDSTTQKNIAWYSSPSASAATAQVKVAASKDMSDATVVDGTSQLGSYTQSGVVSRINYANLTGLEAGKTYYFQVGDGQKWSDVSSFTTAVHKNSEKIFLTADIQEDDALTGFGRIASHIKDGGYDLGIQLGDAVDNVRYYNQWTDALKLFTLDGIADKDMLHVVGNHEADDDGNGAALAKETFNLAGNWYSVEYGDVYIAVLNYTSSQDQLEQFKDWLVQDASASNCNWKILVTHIPVYYTNPTGGGEEYLAELPDAVEKAGIDFYFAGNDHSYARTEPLAQGKVDKENGVVYYICGSTGGKSYSVVNNPDFHFDIATLDFNSIYVSFETNGDKATVTAYNVDTNGNQSVLDTYTKSKTCANDEHNYVYDKDSKKLVCTKCGYETDPVDEKYNGFVQEKQSGKTMCFVSGELVKGSVRFGNKFYFADDDGYAYDGDYTIDGTVCTFKGGYFESSPDGDVLAAGRAGDKVDFILRNDGVMKLVGTGDMYTYYREPVVPWSTFESSIKELDVAAGVTSLSDWAVYHCSNLQKVVFAEGSKLTSVGMNAFDGCTSLASVELPSGVTSISWNAFAHCGSLTDLYLPDGVAWIGGGSGYDFTKESTVTLSVARGTYAEQWAKDHNVRYTSREPKDIASGTCGDGLTWKLSADGVLSIDGDGAMANYAGAGDVPWWQYRSSIKELDVAAGVTSLSDWAVYHCSNLQKVVFAEGSKLTSVGMNAFDGCTSLASVELPSGVTSISWNAFAHCGSLTDLYLPDGVAWIGGGSGYDFTKESTVTLSVARGTYAEQWAKDHNVRYTSREPQAIASLETTSSAQSTEEKLNASEDVAAETSSTDTVATDSASSDAGTVEDEGNASAEEGNAEQESADLRVDAKQGSCGEALTWSLDDDGTLTIDGDGKMTDYSEKSSAPWDELAQDIVSIHVGAKVETIGAYAFSGLEKVESVTFDDESELTEIRDFAFSGCKALKTVELPKKLEKIGQGAFEKCEKLELVKLQESVTSIGEVLVEQDTDQAANEQQPVDAFADSLLVKIEAPEDSYALQYAEEHKLV